LFLTELLHIAALQLTGMNLLKDVHLIRHLFECLASFGQLLSLV
jgi:hypothetical protein